jgi:hypothetical protein
MVRTHSWSPAISTPSRGTHSLTPSRTFFGLAMKLCIELGLHRQKRSSKVCLQSERHKRLFWICYWHERELAIAMGRPPAICDRDIDVEVRNGPDSYRDVALTSVSFL